MVGTEGRNGLSRWQEGAAEKRTQETPRALQELGVETIERERVGN
jgi:hypothetical protein